MTGSVATLREGPLTRFAEAVYRHIALGLCLALACSPTLIALTLIPQDAGSAALFVLAQLPVAPALAAGLYAVRTWSRDPDAGPFAPFWTGYRVNLRDVMTWWTPALLAGGVLAVNITHSATIAGVVNARSVSLVLASVLLLWCGHVLVVSAFFSFRTRDAARLGAIELVSQWRVTLAFVSLLIVAAAVVYLGSELVLLLLVWAFVVMLELVTRPLVHDITERFIAHD